MTIEDQKKSSWSSEGVKMLFKLMFEYLWRTILAEKNENWAQTWQNFITGNTLNNPRSKQADIFQFK